MNQGEHVSAQRNEEDHSRRLYESGVRRQVALSNARFPLGLVQLCVIVHMFTMLTSPVRIESALAWESDGGTLVVVIGSWEMETGE